MESASRVVVAGLGAEDGVGSAEVMVNALREAGAEVVYAGSSLDCERIVAAVIQEDACAIGLVAAGDGDVPEMLTLLRRLREECGDRVAFVASGPFTGEAAAALAAAGVTVLARPGDVVDPACGIVQRAQSRGE